MLIQFDTDPQQILLGNLQTGMQIVATINLEDVIDGIATKGKISVATTLGEELLKLLSNGNGSLLETIDPNKHVIDVHKHIDYELNKD